VLAAALFLSLAACSAPVTHPANAVSNTVSNAVRATPYATATPKATVRKPVAATPAPSAATPAATSVPSPATPQIYSVSATPAVVRGGDSVVWDVRTTPDVVSFAVPNNVPFFFHGNYHLDVAANSSTGDTAHRVVSLTFE